MKDLTKAGLQSVGKNVNDVENQTTQLISALKQVIAEQKRQLETNKAAGLSYTQEAATIQALTGQVRGLEAGLKDLKKTQEETAGNPAKIDIDTEAVDRKANNLKMQFAQVARELPSLAMGPQMFILAISNNLPMLADAIADVRRQNELLAASGEKTVPVWKQIGKALLSPQTALITLITLGSVYGKRIAEWIEKQVAGKKEIESTTKKMESLHKKMEAGAATYGEQIVRLRTLSDSWKKLSADTEKNQWIKDNRTELDRLGISINGVTDADKAFVSQTDAVVEALKLRASAAAAQSLAEEKYKEALLKRNEAELLQNKAKETREKGEMNTTAYMQDTRYGTQLSASELVEERAKGFENEADAAIRAAEAIEKNADAYFKLATAKKTEEEETLKKAGLKTEGSTGTVSGKTDYASQLADARIKAQQTTERLRLQIMQEGMAKRKALAKQEYDESLADIDRQERDTLAKMDKARKQGDTIPQSQYEAVKDTAKTSRILAEQVYNEQIFQIEKEYRDKSSQALIDYYKEYGTYQEKRLATAKDYALKIAAAETEGERMALTEERGNKIQELDFEELKRGMDWEKIFGDLDKVSTDTIERLRKKLKEYLTDIGDDISPESFKEVMDAFDNLDAELADRSPFETLKQSYADYIAATKEVRGAQSLLEQAQMGGSVVIEEYDEKTGELTRKLITQAEAEKMLTDAQDKRASSQKALTQAVNSIGQKGQAVVSAGNDIVDMLSSLGVEVPKAMSDVLGGLDTVMSSLGSIDLMKPFSILTGITGTLKGIGQTIGGLFGLGSDSTERYEALKESLEAMNAIYDKIISKEKEVISFGGGFAAIDAANKAMDSLNRQIDNYRQLAQAAGESGSGVFKHSLAYRTNEAIGSGGFQQVSNLLGKNIQAVQDMYQLSGEELYQVMSKLPWVWSAIDGNIRNYLEQIVDAKDKTAEITDMLNEALTGVTRDSFYNGFIDGLADMETSWEDMCDNFEGQLRKSILAGLVSSEYDKRIQDLYTKWSEAAKSDNRITEKEAEELRNEYQQIIQDLMKQRDEMADAFGWESESGSSQSPDRGALTTMSQDSISRFEGIGRAMQTHLANMDKLTTELRATQQQDSETLSTIASHTAYLILIHELMEDMKINGIKTQ